MNVGIIDIILLVTFIVGIIAVGLFFLNRWATKKQAEQQSFISTNKQSYTVYVIDKKRDKVDNISLPKAVKDAMPKYSKFLKQYFVQVKIGPQIQILMCDKNVYEAIPVKKNVKVDVAGIYIVSFAGLKSKEEMKSLKKEKKAKK